MTVDVMTKNVLEVKETSYNAKKVPEVVEE